MSLRASKVILRLDFSLGHLCFVLASRGSKVTAETLALLRNDRVLALHAHANRAQVRSDRATCGKADR